MTAAARLISATVKYESDRIFDTDRGPRRKVVFEIPGQEDVTVWGNADDPILLGLRRKQAVQLLEKGVNQKGAPVYKIVLADHTETPENLGTTTEPERWSKSHKLQIAKECEQRASLLFFCDSQIRERFSHPEGGLLISEAVVAQYAIALYNDLAPLLK